MALLNLGKILADICLVIVLLADMDQNGSVVLLFFADNLIAGMGTIHALLVPCQLRAVLVQNPGSAETAVFFLLEYQCLQDTGSFDTLHRFHLPLILHAAAAKPNIER